MKKITDYLLIAAAITMTACSNGHDLNEEPAKPGNNTVNYAPIKASEVNFYSNGIKLKGLSRADGTSVDASWDAGMPSMPDLSGKNYADMIQFPSSLTGRTLIVDIENLAQSEADFVNSLPGVTVTTNSWGGKDYTMDNVDVYVPAGANIYELAPSFDLTYQKAWYSNEYPWFQVKVICKNINYYIAPGAAVNTASFGPANNDNPVNVYVLDGADLSVNNGHIAPGVTAYVYGNGKISKATGSNSSNNLKNIAVNIYGKVITEAPINLDGDLMVQGELYSSAPINVRNLEIVGSNVGYVYAGCQINVAETLWFTNKSLVSTGYIKAETIHYGGSDMNLKLRDGAYVTAKTFDIENVNNCRIFAEDGDMAMIDVETFRANSLDMSNDLRNIALVCQYHQYGDQTPVAVGASDPAYTFIFNNTVTEATEKSVVVDQPGDSCAPRYVEEREPQGTEPDPEPVPTPDPGVVSGGHVEVNLALNAERAEGDWLESHLSIHVRDTTDIQLCLPVPAEFYCPADDMHIVGKHDVNYVYNTTTETVSMDINGNRVTLNVRYEADAIYIETVGINSSVLKYLRDTYGDGITFEVRNYYNNGLTRAQLQSMLSAGSWISFTNGTETYLNSYGYDASQEALAKDPLACTVKPADADQRDKEEGVASNDQHAILDIYKRR